MRSTKQGLGEGFEASIELDAIRKHFYKGEDLSKYWKFKFQTWKGESGGVHFTEVQIDGLDDSVRNSLQRPGEKKLGEFYDSITKLSGIEELIWQLGIICPVCRGPREFPTLD